ncbi:MAG: M48 family metallopeptidase [Bifidobacteriaceae bacterium]|jgi:predicted metal-dependent hydrolase|nr:M48 family metallopeptidase [Bifidobacteriaceae bacterium]
MSKTMLNISGIQVEVTRKNIKNMHLSVKPPNGKVTVSAPIQMTDDAIDRFVRIKIGWVKRQIAKFEMQPRQSKREYVSGETLYVWGKQYYMRVEHSNRNSLILQNNNAILKVREESTVKQRESFVREWYRGLLKAEIARLLPKWEQITELKSAGYRTQYMTTRWGTCNLKTGIIRFNLQLAKKPPECLEYVILHELAHFIERTHNARFVAVMDEYMPMWREIKKTLNSQILDYM